MTTRNTFGVLARLRVLPEHADELRGCLYDLSILTRKEYGCISSDTIENERDATEFTILQQWSDEAAHDAHFRTPVIRNAMQFLPHLLSRERDAHKCVLQSNTVRYGTNSYGSALE